MRLFGGNTKVKVERVNATSSMNVFNVQININYMHTLQILYHFYIYMVQKETKWLTTIQSSNVAELGSTKNQQHFWRVMN